MKRNASKQLVNRDLRKWTKRILSKLLHFHSSMEEYNDDDTTAYGAISLAIDDIIFELKINGFK